VIKGLTEFDLFHDEFDFSFSQFVFTFSLVDYIFFQHAGVDDADGAFGCTYDELCAAYDDPIVICASSLARAVERAAAASAGGRRR
jgi:hypothetical protein